ncbi:MAG: hypothetical protein ACRD6X_10030 [Pyrinomonadaceae bacterium]
MKTITLVALFFVVVVAANGQNRSVYTGLGEKVCKTLESSDDEGGFYRGECKGVGGFKLHVIEGDIRQTIDVIYPNGSRSELNLWTVVSGAFSHVGEKAEWRVHTVKKKQVPYALIVRFNTDQEDSNSVKYRNIRTSYLVVVKLGKASACVTDIVLPKTKNQNARARILADAAASKPCLKQG